MTRHALRALIIVVLLPRVVAAQLPQVVAVRGTSDGQGILRAIGDRCLVVTPTHVIKDVLESITVVVSPTQRAEAELLRHTFVDDVSLLAVDDKRSFPCPAWVADNTLGATLELAATGTIVTRGFDGSRFNTEVRIVRVDESTISIEVTKPGGQIMQGMSGSLLIVAGKAAGILGKVDRLGVGLTYRLDFIERAALSTLGGQTRATGASDTQAPSLDELSAQLLNAADMTSAHRLHEWRTASQQSRGDGRPRWKSRVLLSGASACTVEAQASGLSSLHCTFAELPIPTLRRAVSAALPGLRLLPDAENEAYIELLSGSQAQRRVSLFRTREAPSITHVVFDERP